MKTKTMKKWTAGERKRCPWVVGGQYQADPGNGISTHEGCWDLRGHSKDTRRRVASVVIAVTRNSTFEWSSGSTFSSRVPPSLVQTATTLNTASRKSCFIASDKTPPSKFIQVLVPVSKVTANGSPLQYPLSLWTHNQRGKKEPGLVMFMVCGGHCTPTYEEWGVLISAVWKQRQRTLAGNVRVRKACREHEGAQGMPAPCSSDLENLLKSKLPKPGVGTQQSSSCVKQLHKLPSRIGPQFPHL